MRGYSLAVVDTPQHENRQRLSRSRQRRSSWASRLRAIRTMRRARSCSRPTARAGVVRVYDLDDSGPAHARSADRSRYRRRAAVARFRPASPSRRTAAPRLSPIISGDAVITIDLATRTVQRSVPVGDFPFYVAAGRAAVLATGSGLSSYSAIVPPAIRPRFAAPAFDPSRSSSLTVLALGGSNAIGDPAAVRMDPAPDGTQIVGGAVPGCDGVEPRRPLRVRRTRQCRPHRGRRPDRRAARRARPRPSTLSRRTIRRAAERGGAQPGRQAPLRRARRPQCRRGARRAQADPLSLRAHPHRVVSDRASRYRATAAICTSSPARASMAGESSNESISSTRRSSRPRSPRCASIGRRA